MFRLQGSPKPPVYRAAVHDYPNTPTWAYLDGWFWRPQTGKTMGQKSAIDLLPDGLRKRVFELLDNPQETQAGIVDLINLEAGKEVLSKSSMNRFVKAWRKEKTIAGITSSEASLLRIAAALERIATYLEKH
ncbi:MAG: DUF3486 family protein [Treponema sp.]|jgi:uncharacterized protein (DUF1778 family)|nr:DUF3486 family protein [Treponema sp.]